MKDENYRKKIEEHRQSIEIENEQSNKLSRSQRNVKSNKRKKSKKRKNPLITILLCILLGIPSLILIYVWGFYEPKTDTEVAEVEKTNTVVELHTNDTVASDSKEKSKTKVEKEEVDSKEESRKEKSKKEESKEDDTSNKEIEDQAASDAAKLQEQQTATENQTQETQTQDTQQANQEQSNEGQQVHTVQANENLYRIALKYGCSVDDIKAANNLPSESISVGQTLIIP